MTETPTAHRTELAPYLPRLVRVWSTEAGAPRARVLDGSLVSVDISGFTALSERLAEKGREGAEELVRTISGIFAELIEVAERHGGDVLKFRGDALLLLFVGDSHPARACGAASDMQWTIERIGAARSSAGEVELRMSAGVHSGPIHVFLTERPHRELLVAGPAATRVFELEDLAGASEIVASAETAAAVEPAWLLEERDGARLLRRLEPGSSDVPPPPDLPGERLEEYVPTSLRDHLAVASGEAEHRHVPVAFVKLAGTDALLTELGPEGFLARLDEVAAVVDRVCRTYGVTWLESDIDVGAVKLYFTAGAPSSTGDDAEGMLRALRDLIDASPVPLRAGVHRGHVFTGDIGSVGRRTYAVMGDPVNLAARLTARAGDGEILATADVLEAARTLYESGREPLLVKGKERAVIAHHVGRATGMRDTTPADALPIVGREEELALLRGALDAARMRQFGLVELVGEPGMGKSRLVAEVRTQALGFAQLSLAGEQYAQAVPYGAWRNALRQLVGIMPDRSREEAGAQLAPLVTGMMPDLAPWLPLLANPFDAEVPSTPEVDALDATESRERLQAIVATFLERMLMMPTLVVVEDAHWLDDSSRGLLQEVAGPPMPRPWLVLVTSRPSGEPIVSPGVPGQRIELAPLDAGAAEQLALAAAEEHALSADAMQALAERAGGNPLFLRELVAAARDGADRRPAGVGRDAADDAHRHARAGGPHAAALCGRRGPVVRAGARRRDPRGRASRAATIPRVGRRSRSSSCPPATTSSRSGTTSSGRPPMRVSPSGAAARSTGASASRLSAAPGERAEEEAAILSLHFLEAGDGERAWRYAVAAADRAAAGFANVVAAELYERALAAHELRPVDAAERARVLEALGDVRERFGAYEPAREAYQQAREAHEAPLDRARLLARIAHCLDREGRYDEALQTFGEARALVSIGSESGAELETLAEIEIGLASVSYRRAIYADAIEHATAAADLAERASLPATLAHALLVSGVAHTDLGRPEAVPLFEHTIAISEEHGLHRLRGSALNNLGIHHYTEGRWDDAVACYRASREAKLRAGDPLGAAVQENNVAEVLSDQGRLEEAEPLFRNMVRVCRAARFPIGASLGTSNLGRLAARDGRFAEAHELFDDSAAGFAAIDAGRYVNETHARRAECLVLEGRFAEALEVASALVEAARETPFGGLEALVERTIGLALHQARRPEEGRPHLLESLRIARELEAVYERALTLRALADTKAPDADAHRAESETLLARLGVVALAKVPLP